MKKFILLALMAILTMGTYAQKEQSVVIKTNAALNCQKCADRFSENVPFFKGVKTYTYDAKTAVLTIKYDANKTNPDQLRKDISKLGYNADNVAADPKARENLPACCKGGGSCSDAKSAEHKCQHGEGEHKCQGQSGDHKCSHQCQGQNGEHKCQGQSAEHKCQGQSGDNKCSHQCQGQNGEHKCQGQSGDHKCSHQCQGQNGEHKCQH
ncbi:MAG: heavy-metal-associated domain-containing protein [Bacteroidales bacterium]|nr:heavy-metal-associated domain-containing protein [Bacteroidales bacterium]